MSAASAADLYSDYGVSTTVTWDDNYRLSEEDQISNTTVGARVYGDLRGGDEITKLLAGVSLGGGTNSESSIDDTQDISAYFNGSRQGERWAGTLDLSYYLAPTTETELLDTGNTEVDGERKTLNIGPGISYQFDELNSGYSSISYTDVSYDTVSLTGYTDNSISAGWVHSLSETSNVSLNGSYSEFMPEDGDTTTVSRVSLGYGFSTSEATQYNIDLGFAESTDASGETSSDGSSSFSMSHTIDERNTFSLYAGNGYVASGAGEVRYQGELNLSWGHALAERLQFNLSAQGITSDERDYFQTEVGIYHRITRETRFGANYRHRIEHTDTQDADSNSVFLTLSYSPVSEWSY